MTSNILSPSSSKMVLALPCMAVALFSHCFLASIIFCCKLSRASCEMQKKKKKKRKIVVQLNLWYKTLQYLRKRGSYNGGGTRGFFSMLKHFLFNKIWSDNGGGLISEVPL